MHQYNAELCLPVKLKPLWVRSNIDLDIGLKHEYAYFSLFTLFRPKFANTPRNCIHAIKNTVINSITLFLS